MHAWLRRGGIVPANRCHGGAGKIERRPDESCRQMARTSHADGRGDARDRRRRIDAAGAVAAAPVHSCGNKAVVLEQPGETGQPPTKFKLLVKQVTSQGVSCTDAFKVVTALYKGSAKPGKIQMHGRPLQSARRKTCPRSARGRVGRSPSPVRAAEALQAMRSAPSAFGRVVVAVRRRRPRARARRPCAPRHASGRRATRPRTGARPPWPHTARDRRRAAAPPARGLPR